MRIKAKLIIFFSVIILAFLIVGLFFFRNQPSISQEADCNKKKRELSPREFLAEFMSVFQKERDHNNLELSVGKISFSGDDPESFVYGLITNQYSCLYNNTREDPAIEKEIKDEVTRISEHPRMTENNFLKKTTVLSAMDYLENNMSGDYRFFPNMLLFGDWEEDCENKLASLCRPGEFPLTEGAASWCRGLCQKISEYKANQDILIDEVISDEDKIFFQSNTSVFFKESVAFRLGGREFAGRVCDILKENFSAYTFCQNAIVVWESRLKSCGEVKDLMTRFICGK